MNISAIHLIFLFTISLLFANQSIAQKVVEIDPETGYFPGRNKNIKVITSVKVKPKVLKSILLVVPDNKFVLGMVNNMNFFEKIMTDTELIQQLTKQSLVKEIESQGSVALTINESNNDPIIPETNNLLSEALRQYDLFMFLELTDWKVDGKYYAGIVLSDYKNQVVYFESHIRVKLMWDGWSDKGTYYPLFNSLLKYLKEL